MSVIAAAVIGSTVVGAVSANKAAKASDKATAAQSAAAEETAQLGRDRLAFEKQQYADGKGARDAATATAQEVMEAQLASQKQNDALAAEYANYSRTTFRPLEQSMVADAAGYDTPEKRQAAADAAMGDVNKAFSATGQARARSMAAEGIDPGSARAMSVMQGQDVDQAVANAGAAYTARKGVETVGRAMKNDAVSLGRGLPGNQATSAQIALSAGNSAVNSGQVPVGIQQQSGAGIGAGYNSAIAAQGTAGNLYGQVANRSAGAGDGLFGAMGNLAGQWAGSASGSAAISNGFSKVGALFGLSDETVKTDIEPVNPDQALEEVAETPVSTWKYDPAKMAARGLPMEPGDEGSQTGPMAQDVNATMGEGASDGKKINLVTMNGKAMAAIQALDKKVNKLAALIGGGQLEARAA
jgi:hypothetical protein